MDNFNLIQWLPWLGWILLFLGWGGQRKDVQRWVNKVTVFGSHNQIHNQ